MSGSLSRKILDKDNVRDLAKDLEALVEEIVKKYKPLKVLLTGSLAEGRFVRGLSDIDLLVIVKNAEAVGERFLLYRVRDVDVEVTVVAEKELEEAVKAGNQFYTEALRRGITAYDKGKSCNH